jgi:carboxylesterase
MLENQPESSRGFSSRTKSPQHHLTAHRADQEGILQEVEVVTGAEAFAMGDGPIGALLIHGFTGSPQGLRDLGAYLAERGIAIAAPRLPGHGTSWQDLDLRRPEEWVAAVEESFAKMRSEREQVFLVGLSFGAALALDLAARHRHEIAGIVTLAGMVETRDPRRLIAWLIRLLTPSLQGAGNDIADPEASEISYGRLPTSATQRMLRFLRRARSVLPGVDCPILIVHSRNDHTVGPYNAQTIYDSVSSQHKELVWLDRSYHVLTLDLDRDDVFARTYNFIAANTHQRSSHDGI